MGNVVPKKKLPKFLRKSKSSKTNSGSTSPTSDASVSTQSPRTTSPSPPSSNGRQEDPPSKSPRALPLPKSPRVELPQEYYRRDSQSSTDTGIPARVRKAAKAITDGDAFLLFAGSGFLADSGLSLHKELTEVPQYRSRGLSYAGLGDPCWLDSDLSLFYGFWGTLFNDFRWSRPHEGYSILASWREKFFHGTAASESIKQRTKSDMENYVESSDDPDPYKCRAHEAAGAFFIFTSNVDAHFFDYFGATEVRECHGNVELWQCSNVCSKRVWRAPRSYIFRVDLRNMLASDPPGTNMDSGVDEMTATKIETRRSEAEQRESGREERKMGKRRRDWARIKWLENLPATEDTNAVREMFGRPNRPICPLCKAPARPNVLMASDLGWIDNTAQEKRWCSWLQAVKDESQGSQGNKRRVPPLNVVIMEIGAGLTTVPTARATSQSVAGRLEQSGANVTMVRINPSTPGPDGAKGARLKHFIDLRLKGLEALKMINEEVQATLRRQAVAAV